MAGQRVLITGAAGGVGTILRRGLANEGWIIRGYDLVIPEGAADETPEGARETEWIQADLADTDRLAEAMRDVDAVIHLAGIPGERDFAAIRTANIDGTHHVFEAAHQAAVPRVIYASSNHAVGFHDRDDFAGEPAGVDIRPRPDTFYGVSKVFGEALGSYYADRHGLQVVCVRIGSCFEDIKSVRMLETWLSPADAVRLFHALLTAPDVRFEVVYGISANTRGWMDLGPARRLGYEPRDDAERFRDEVERKFGELDADDPEYRFLGGRFTTFGPNRGESR